MAVRIEEAARTRQALVEGATLASGRLLGRVPVRVETFPAPPQRMRESVRVVFATGTAIATRRSMPRWHEREVEVLRLLGGRGAPVPRLLACDGTWLLQEDVGNRRASQIINDPHEPDPGSWVDRCLRALDEVHAAARAAGLPKEPEPWHRRRQRYLRHMSQMHLLSTRLGLPPPAIRPDAILELVPETGCDFLKGDTNIADFIVGQDGAIRLVDWEFARPGCGLEDVGQFVASEMVPPETDPADRLPDLCPYAFRAFPCATNASAFLVVCAALTIVRRLSVLISWKEGGVSWSWEQCVETGLPGVAWTGIERLCLRGRQWAAKSAVTAPLAPWFDALERHLRSGLWASAQSPSAPQ